MHFDVKKFVSDAESALKHFVGSIAQPVENALKTGIDSLEESAVKIGIDALPPIVRTICAPIAEHIGGDVEKEINDFLDNLERKVAAWAANGVSLHVLPSQVAAFESEPLSERLAEVKMATAKKGE